MYGEPRLQLGGLQSEPLHFQVRQLETAASARVRCLTVQNSYQEEQREYERLSGMQ